MVRPAAAAPRAGGSGRGGCVGGAPPARVRPAGGAGGGPAATDANTGRRQPAFGEAARTADPRHTRNRLRHEVVPMLCAAFGRDVRRAIWRAAELCSAEHEFLAGILAPSDNAPELD